MKHLKNEEGHWPTRSTINMTVTDDTCDSPVGAVILSWLQETCGDGDGENPCHDDGNGNGRGRR